MKILKQIGIIILSTLCILAIIGASGYWLLKDRFTTKEVQNWSASFDKKKQQLVSVINKNSITTIGDEKALETAQLKGIVASLQDPYSEYLSADEYKKFRDGIDEKYEGIGIKFNQKDGKYTITKVLKDSPALKAGLQIDDMLSKINGEDIAAIPFDEIAKKIRGKSGTAVELELLRAGQPVTVSVTRSPIQNELVTLEKRGNVGIITISSFGSSTAAKFKEVAQTILNDSSITALVLDMRSNTGGLLKESIDVASMIADEGVVMVKEKTKNGDETLKTNKQSLSLGKYPMVITVDSITASASEILAAGLRDTKQVKIVGQKTYGKGVVQSLYPLENGDTIKLTTAEWFTPKDQQINKKGVVPDIVIPQTEDAIVKAIEELKK
jgi:carboxyl-terminal processing protease